MWAEEEEKGKDRKKEQRVGRRTRDHPGWRVLRGEWSANECCKELVNGGWRGGSVIRSICCSSKGPEFGSQFLH